jgi:hypothetical protein
MPYHMKTTVSNLLHRTDSICEYLNVYVECHYQRKDREVTGASMHMHFLEQQLQQKHVARAFDNEKLEFLFLS